MIASGYTMDLYCEVEGAQHKYRGGMAQIGGETWADCVKQAKMIGWKIDKKKRECICPKCQKEGLKIK